MLLPILLKAKLVELMASKIQPKLSLETYNSESHCDYHRVMVGHYIDMSSRRFKVLSKAAS